MERDRLPFLALVPPNSGSAISTARHEADARVSPLNAVHSVSVNLRLDQLLNAIAVRAAQKINSVSRMKSPLIIKVQNPKPFPPRQNIRPSYLTK